MEIIAETDRLLIKVFEETDAQDATAFWGNEEVMGHCNGAVPHEILPKVLKSYADCHAAKGLSVYGVVEKGSGRVIGAAGFNVPSSLETVELIYHFAKAGWGKGYATEAAAACVEFAKKAPNVGKIYASADLKNAGSLKILEKIGFTYKGMKWFEDTNQEEPYYEMEIS